MLPLELPQALSFLSSDGSSVTFGECCGDGDDADVVVSRVLNICCGIVTLTTAFDGRLALRTHTGWMTGWRERPADESVGLSTA